jgi:hypothetical protein
MAEMRTEGLEEPRDEPNDPSSELGSNPNFIQRALAFAKDNAEATFDVVYSAAIGGVNGFGGAIQIGDHYKNGNGSLRERAERLVKWQCVKTGASGFVTGMGGAITIPASMTAALYVQIVMVAAIAHMAGKDVKSDEVKSLVLLLMVGDSTMVGGAKDMGIKAANKIFAKGVKKIPGNAIKAVNKALAPGLVVKYGAGGVVNLGKMIPFAGGVFGATFDSLATSIVGKRAVKLFITDDAQNGAP